MIQAQQILFAGGKLIKGISVLDKVKSIQENKYELEYQKTILTVIDAYYNLFLAQEALSIQKQALETATLHLNRVENMFHQGLVSEYDKLRAELEVARLTPDVLNFENMKNLAEENFKIVTGYTGEVSLNPGLENNISNYTQMDLTLDNAMKIAKEKRIELYLSAVFREIYGVQYSAEKGFYMPNLVLQGDYIRFSTPDGYKVKYFGESWSAGIALQMPLFAGGSNVSKMLRTKHELRKAEYDDDNINEMIMLEVRQIWQSYNQSLKSLETQIQNLELSQRALNIAQRRFENQSGIQLEIFDAQIQYNAAQMSVARAKIQVITDYFKLNKALGNNLTNLIGEL
jgi:outer membrane protein TolC